METMHMLKILLGIVHLVVALAGKSAKNNRNRY